MAASLNRLAVIYEEMGNETMNIKCILEGLDAIREGDDRLLEAKLYNNLGSRFMRINDYSRALDCLNLAAQAHDGIVIDDANASLDRNRISDVNEFEVIMNLNFSSIYYHLDNFAQAKHHFDMVISPYITVSQGYSSAYAEPGDTIETMINLADLVLYSVKRRGRNGYNYTGYKDILINE